MTRSVPSKPFSEGVWGIKSLTQKPSRCLIPKPYQMNDTASADGDLEMMSHGHNEAKPNYLRSPPSGNWILSRRIVSLKDTS